MCILNLFKEWVLYINIPPMEIIRAFENNNLSIQITILGTYEDPLFRASNIGEVLEINQIRHSIQDFDDTEKCLV
jgi:hypothetical protein